MPTIPISNNPISRLIDLRVTDAIDIVYRKPKVDLLVKGKSKLDIFEEKIARLKSKLSDEGFLNQTLRIVEGDVDDHDLPLVIAPYLYLIKWSSPDFRDRFDRRFDRIIDMHKWCEDNCSGEFTLDQSGATFSSEQDAFLWQMRF